MTDDEKEHLSLVIQTSLNTAMTPIIQKLADHDMAIQANKITLMGVNGDNGLNSEVKSLKRKFNRIIVFGGIAQGFGVGLGAWLNSFFGKH